MFQKRKGFTLVELLIVIIVIGILAGAMMLASGSATDSAKASALISELRAAKAGGYIFVADLVGKSWTDIADYWTGIPGASFVSFDFMDNEDKLQELDFQAPLVTVTGGHSVLFLLVGKPVEDPVVAGKMVSMMGGALFKANGTRFEVGDPYAYMRVK